MRIIILKPMLSPTYMMSSPIRECRICKCDMLESIIDLGNQVITSRFPVYGDYSTPTTPIQLVMCKNCWLVQLGHNMVSSELYEHEYGYRSGLSNTMREHLKQYNHEIRQKIQLNDGDVVLDIGSNDSTMLQNYPQTLKRIGIDPTGSQFQEYYGDVELIPTYFTKDVFMSKYGDRKCKVVTTISMFYDLPDPVQFAKDIYDVLDDEGIWTCEQSYLLTMIKRNSVDTICHEHLEYYALHQIQEIAKRAYFKIIDIKFNDCNGGSFRVYLAKHASKHPPNTLLINSILNDELAFKIHEPQTYRKFINDCDDQVRRLKMLIDTVNTNGQEIWIYGASTKGNCLLQYAGIDQTKARYAVERNMKKVGKMTSTGVEIISEEDMRKSPPKFLLVLPWHFRDEIIVRESEFLDNGGQLVFPFPKFEIVSRKPRLLITGCDGQVAAYCKERFEKEYELYGITRSSIVSEKDIIKFKFDMRNNQMIEDAILLVNPTRIIHLASITHADVALLNPVETLEMNGLLIAKICDIIHRNKLDIHLFNASSSEIYKGHKNYVISENDTHHYNLHPYAIGKSMGHSIVDFYRDRCKIHCSNGVIFTTESVKRKDGFLSSKIMNHARTWKERNDILDLGSLDSYRNYLHARDVAEAIYIILNQPHGDSYLICNSHMTHVSKFVEEVYAIFNIRIYRKDDIYYEHVSNKPVIRIGELFRGQSTSIDGICVKLKALGWEPKSTLKELANEIRNVSGS